MKPRGILLAIGALTVVLVGLIWFAGTRTPACTMELETALPPIELEFAGEPVSVAACMDAACTPLPLSRKDDGGWQLPQELRVMTGAAKEAAAARTVTVTASYREGHTTTQTLPLTLKKQPEILGCGESRTVEFLPVQVP